MEKKMVVRPCLSHLSYEGQIQCLKPVFLALERLLDRRIVMAYLVYIMTSRTANTTQWNPVSNGSLKSPLSDYSDHMTSCLPGIIGSSHCIQKTCSTWAMCVSCTRHRRMQCWFSTHRPPCVESTLIILGPIMSEAVLEEQGGKTEWGKGQHFPCKRQHPVHLFSHLISFRLPSSCDVFWLRRWATYPTFH